MKIYYLIVLFFALFPGSKKCAGDDFTPIVDVSSVKTVSISVSNTPVTDVVFLINAAFEKQHSPPLFSILILHPNWWERPLGDFTIAVSESDWMLPYDTNRALRLKEPAGIPNITMREADVPINVILDRMVSSNEELIKCVYTNNFAVIWPSIRGYKLNIGEQISPEEPVMINDDFHALSLPTVTNSCVNNECMSTVVVYPTGNVSVSVSNSPLTEVVFLINAAFEKQHSNSLYRIGLLLTGWSVDTTSKFSERYYDLDQIMQCHADRELCCIDKPAGIPRITMHEVDVPIGTVLAGISSSHKGIIEYTYSEFSAFIWPKLYGVTISRVSEVLERPIRGTNQGTNQGQSPK